MALLRGGLRAAVGVSVAGSLLLFGVATRAQAPPTIENEVKAAFLYNFAKYVEWPPAAFDADGTFRLCVLADAAFLKHVDAIVAGETIDGRKVIRQTPAAADSARACQILFVGRGELDRAERLLSAVQGAPVLTVSDAPNFLNRGGTIAFTREGDRVRFDVNLTEAQRSGLSISSRLLRVARRVSPATQGH
jgi:hypothetical protein